MWTYIEPLRLYSQQLQSSLNEWKKQSNCCAHFQHILLTGSAPASFTQYSCNITPSSPVDDWCKYFMLFRLVEIRAAFLCSNVFLQTWGVGEGIQLEDLSLQHMRSKINSPIVRLNAPGRRPQACILYRERLSSHATASLPHLIIKQMNYGLLRHN